jgi:hypothetical protein
MPRNLIRAPTLHGGGRVDKITTQDYRLDRGSANNPAPAPSAKRPHGCLIDAQIGDFIYQHINDCIN